MIRNNYIKISLAVIIYVFGEIIIEPSQANTVWREHSMLTASDAEGGDQFGYSVSISGNYCIVGTRWDDDNGSNSGSAYIYKYNDPDWIEYAKLTASDGSEDDYFGASVSISGDHVIIGAYEDEAAGSAYIFRQNDSNWIEYKITSSDGDSGDHFGQSVSISGDYAIIGAYGNDNNGTNSGSAYIFKCSDPNWIEQSKLTASDGDINDQFGKAVSIFGDYAIVGAWISDPFEIEDAGSAYIFKRDGEYWIEQVKLIAPDPNEDNRFGYAVSIYEDYAIVGTYMDDDPIKGIDSGSAYIFKREGEDWTLQRKIIGTEVQSGDKFGYAVSITDKFALVGTSHIQGYSSSGSTYLFKQNSNGWEELQILPIPSTVTTDGRFGWSVEIYGNSVIVGASHNGVLSTGAAYIFQEIECPTADLNGDCCVNMLDLNIMASQWLQCR